MTMGKVSDIICFGKPDRTQLAYSGYKDNIEAFLHATAVKKKTSVSAGHFPIPADYHPTVPLPLPRTIFKLAKKPNADFLKRMKEGLEKFGLEEVYVGKGDPSFILSTPGYSSLSTTIASISLPRGPVVESTCQLESAILNLRVYQCVDLFLRTNTYSYKEGAEETWALNPDKRGSGMEARVGGYWYRDGFNAKTKVPKTSAGESVRVRIEEDETEPIDTTPHLSGMVSLDAVVLVAKPSNKPATSSYGTPAEVPFVSGILFPYFQGMLSGDSAGYRELVTSLFYRNLGVAGKDNRDAYKEFRAGMGSFATTASGIIMTHVLKGIQMSLQTQTHLFLLIETGVYHGFVLLGEHFSVFAHGAWKRPLAADDLRDDLKRIKSHTASLADVREILGQCQDINGDSIMVEEENLQTSVDLADLLSRVNIEENEDQVEELRKSLQNLSFPSRFRTFRPDYIREAIEFLTTKRNSFPRDLPIFLSSEWAKMGTVEYKTFASFGPKGFSFRNAVGTEINIPKAGEEDPMGRKNEDGKLIYPRLIVGEKSIAACITEWEALRVRGMIRMDLTERASGSRNRIFTDKSKEIVWTALKAAKDGGFIGVGGPQKVIPQKRVVDIAFGKGDHDTITF